MVDQGVLRRIAEGAASAPSVHNTQPWRFVARGDNVLELWTDPSRGLAVLDPSGRARHLSCGAAVSFAGVAAAAEGCAADIAVLPDPAEPDHLADIRIGTTVASLPVGDLAEAIARRRTSRGPFATRTIPYEVIHGLRAAVESEGCWLRVVTDEESPELAVLLARADDLQLSDPAYREELRRWTTAADTTVEGVPTAQLPGEQPTERGSNFRLRDFRAEPADDLPFAGSGEDPPPVERPLVVVLGTRHDDVRSWLAAGQGFGRLILAAAEQGLAASPMTQVLETPHTRARLDSVLGVVGHAQMVLRLGYPGGDEELPRPSPRRRVDDILTVTE